MKDLSTLQYHKVSEDLVSILCRKTQNNNHLFFRILVAYYLCKLASNMRVHILTKDRGIIPINMYAINLSPSGEGKNFATNIIEEQVTNGFKTEFLEQTVPKIADANVAKLSNNRAAIKDIDEDENLIATIREYESLGAMPFSFDSGTTAAVKQLRHKMLMAQIGALSLQIDEIGNNLLGNADVLATFLECYDTGILKQKITKNTRENVRNEEIDGRVPANMLLFGTPSKLLNGGKIEDEFYSFLETGYARRCLFGFTKFSSKTTDMTAEEVYDILIDTASNARLQQISNQFAKLAVQLNHNKTIVVSKDVSILLIEYRMHCEALAEAYAEHEDIRKAEMNHRYFKALKLAGAYAFTDGIASITEDHLYAAIKMVEESGQAFEKLLRRDRNYVKLAKYIAAVGREVTHVDLTEDLPFYKGSIPTKQDMLQLAIAWGYKNQIIIKKTTTSGIEFITGEALKNTDLNKLILAHSADIASNYANVQAPFDQLHKLTQKSNYNWINHHSLTGDRNEADMSPGFNMVVFDIDDGSVSIPTVQTLLKDYKYLIYTTKRHTPAANRFRLVMPINYQLNLDENDFKEFMKNLYEWLPFDVDRATAQRSRKWLTHDGHYYYGSGDQLLDALPFIPKTSKNDERKQIIQSQQSLSNLERWFVLNSNGGRNNQLVKYALLLVDMGCATDVVRTSVLELNNKLTDKLLEKEIDSTIMQTVAKKILEKA